MSMHPTNFPPRRDSPQRLHPKRVRGGLKLESGSDGSVPWASSWAAQRWIRLLEQGGDGAGLIEGLQYAKMGQTKTLVVEPGGVNAVIQGRADRPYTTRLKLPAFNDEQWLKIVGAMGDQAMYAAKLLSGELPATIEDIFVPLGLKLFPVESSEVTAECSCQKKYSAYASTVSPHELVKDLPPVAPSVEGAGEAASTGEGAGAPSAGDVATPPVEPAPAEPVGWCKHACCAAYLFAERLATDPFLMFKVRGMPGPELIDRLRHSRAVAGGVKGATGLYLGRVAGVSDVEAEAFESLGERFWELGAELGEIDLSIRPPEVSHPLLRRLGPSPFVNSAFPLVGLLASCYETISRDVIERAMRGEEPLAEPAPEAGDDESDEG